MKLTFNAPFTIVYTFVSCFVFFILLENDLFENAFFLNGVTNFNNWQWYAGTLGYIAGHANFNHLAGNFMFILLLGPIVENHYGSKKISRKSKFVKKNIVIKIFKKICQKNSSKNKLEKDFDL